MRYPNWLNEASRLVSCVFSLAFRIVHKHLMSQPVGSGKTNKLIVSNGRINRDRRHVTDIFKTYLGIELLTEGSVNELNLSQMQFYVVNWLLFYLPSVLRLSDFAWEGKGQNCNPVTLFHVLQSKKLRNKKGTIKQRLKTSEGNLLQQASTRRAICMTKLRQSAGKSWASLISPQTFSPHLDAIFFSPNKLKLRPKKDSKE